MGLNLKLVKNATGRYVPTIVNGVKSVPFMGVGKHSPKGMKAAPPIRSCQNYPASGNKLAKSLHFEFCRANFVILFFVILN